MNHESPALGQIKRKMGITIPSTARIEAFSDGIFAFVATLLVIELNPPVLTSRGSGPVWQALQAMWPKFFCFAFSFFTIVIVWVNHHHFFHQLEKSDAKLLWCNNFLLFFLTIVPFTTAFLGDYPWEPTVAFVYGAVMFLAIFSFYLMARHAFLKSTLLEKDYPLANRRREVNKAGSAALLYAIACAISFIYEPLTLLIFVIIPLINFIPSVIDNNS